LDRLLDLVKVFVVVSGILIILGTVTLVWLIASREPDPEPVAVSEPSDAPAPEAALPATEHVGEVAMPAGSVVIETRLDGDRALLLLRGAEGEDYLALVELATGRRLSLLRLVPETP
jgi:hypothetical protein